MKQKWIDAYMDTAERFAQLSSAVKLKVGSVVVKDHRIISIGYNGTPHGWDNVCEVYEEAPPMKDAMEYQDHGYRWTDMDGEHKWMRLKTKDEVIHAEANAIIKLAKFGEGGNGASIFCTHAPCIHCAKMILGAGITKLYYRNTYRSGDGLEFLIKSGVDINQV